MAAANGSNPRPAPLRDPASAPQGHQHHGRSRPWRVEGMPEHHDEGEGEGVPRPPHWKEILRRSWWFLILVLLANWLILSLLFGGGTTSRTAVSYSFFHQQVLDHNVSEVTTTGDSITGAFRDDVRYPPKDESATKVKDFESERPAFSNDHLVQQLLESGAKVSAEKESTGSSWTDLLVAFVPTLLIIGLLVWLFRRGMAAAGARTRRLRTLAGASVRAGNEPPDHLRRRRWDRRGQGRGHGDRGLPQGPRPLPAARRADPPRSAAHRRSGNREDAAGAGGRRRGGGSVPVDLGVGVHRDDRRRRREQGARPVRAGQEGGTFDHLHRRARRDRPGPWRGDQLQRSRRAGADAQPDPHRDGRVHRQRGRGRAGRHQPTRDPRPCPAAGGEVRPSHRREPTRPGRSATHPRGAHPRCAAVRFGLTRTRRIRHFRHGRRRTQEPRQRGRPPGSPAFPREGRERPTSPTRSNGSFSAPPARS